MQPVFQCKCFSVAQDLYVNKDTGYHDSKNLNMVWLSILYYYMYICKEVHVHNYYVRLYMFILIPISAILTCTMDYNP